VVKQKIWLQFYQPLMKSFLSDVDVIAATSPNYVDTSPVLKQFPEKTRIIPIGIDKKNYPVPSPERLAQWQAKFNTPFFLFIGNLRYYKGISFLMEAAKTVEAPIVIVGSIKTGGSQLAEQRAKHNYSNLHFLDEISEEDKTALLMLCYGLVMPSHLRSEAFGIALLEGAMFGKPLISCEIGTGTTYVNMANETGLVVPPADSKALAQAMQCLLANPSTARAMGLQAEYRFNTLFTADKMAESYLQLYQDIL
jgi:rhamnosyl/mannosyltransferase